MDIGKGDGNMADTNWNTIFSDIFKASQNSYRAKDDTKMSIAIQKANMKKTWMKCGEYTIVALFNRL